MKNLIVQEDIEYIISCIGDWERLSGKTVMVSGANGFLPAYMIETLLKLNESLDGNKIKIIGIVRNKEKAFSRFSDYLDRSDFQLIVQDINNRFSFPGGIDYIIHAASQASPKFFGTDPVGTLSTNVLGTYNLLELAREKNVDDFLFFSSAEVYGAVDVMPIKEESYGYIDPLNVRSCYAESKRMGETMCVSWSYQFGIPVKIIRPFHTYGPRMHLHDGRVFADFVSDIVTNRDIVMKSDGSALRAFCYLADATAGFFKVLLNGKNREAYNVGNDKGEVSIIQLANMLVNLFPEKGLKVVRQDTPSDGSYLKSKINRALPDISKIRTLGWEPHYSVEEGFKRTIRSFLS